MAVVSCEETYTRTASLDRTLAGRYTRTFVVETDDPETGPIAARLAPGIAIGTPYQSKGNTESDNFSFAANYDVRGSTEDGKQYEVTISYEPYSLDLYPDTGSPLDVPPQVSWTQNETEQIIDIDVNDIPILNSAGDPFDPPVVIPRSLPVLQIIRNEAPATAIATLQVTYCNKLNDATFFGAAAGQALCKSIEARREYHPLYGFYWTVQYVFFFNPDGWKKYVLDAGYRKLVSGARKPILIGADKPTSPVLLDGSGAVLAEGDDPVLLEFDVYPEADFSILGLE